MPTAVGWLFQNVLALIPFRFYLVKSSQQGVRLKRGVVAGTLGPGVYFGVVMLWTVEVFDVAEQGMNLPNQTVTTADGRAVTFSSNLSYTIDDAGKFYTVVQDLDNTLIYEAMRHAAKAIRVDDYDTVVGDQDAVEGVVFRSLSRRVAEWGVCLTGYGLTDFVEATTFRVIGDPSLIVPSAGGE